MTPGTVPASRLDETLPLPEAKKAKIDNSSHHLAFRKELVYCQKLLLTSHETPSIPPSLLEHGKVRNNLVKLKKLVDAHGFRTSMIASPRAAVSIYKDSFHLESANDDKYLDGKVFLVTAFGLHPEQAQMEHYYATSIKQLYCLLLFCHRLRKACPSALKDETVSKLILENETLCHDLGRTVDDPKTLEQAHTLSLSVPKRVATLMNATFQAEPRNRVEQLQHEYDRITVWNSTLSNALISQFLQAHDCCIKDIYFKPSHLPKYERMTIYLYDSEIDHYKPPHFLFLPSIQTALEHGPEAIVQEMISSFWSHLLRHGYFATKAMKEVLNPNLQHFFLSGITHDVKIPLQL